jgi:hypothetical protein
MLWAVRPGGNDAADWAVADNRWVGSVAGEAPVVVKKGEVEGNGHRWAAAWR